MAGLACVGVLVGDEVIVMLTLFGAVPGFFVWNFPGRRVYLRDGGACFLGFFVAGLSV